MKPADVNLVNLNIYFAEAWDVANIILTKLVADVILEKLVVDVILTKACCRRHPHETGCWCHARDSVANIILVKLVVTSSSRNTICRHALFSRGTYLTSLANIEFVTYLTKG